MYCPYTALACFVCQAYRAGFLDCKDCSFAEYGRDADLNGPEYLAEQFRAGFMPAYTAIQLLGIVSDQVNRRRVRLAA